MDRKKMPEENMCRENLSKEIPAGKMMPEGSISGRVGSVEMPSGGMSPVEMPSGIISSKEIESRENFSRKSESPESALIRQAFAALPNAYAPYSGFHVAAAVLCGSGRIYTGVNVENASFPAGICAERNAISHAAAEGERKIRAVAIIGGPHGQIHDYCAPCGICRQVMREFGDPAEVRLLLARSPEDYVEKTLEELLPMSFGPESLASG